MTYEKIFADVKKVYSKADKSKLCGDFAFQFNITGEGGGAFYVAFRGGILEVAPYDYVDKNALLIASGEDFIKLANSRFTLQEAVDNGIIQVEGDFNMALELDKMALSGSEKKDAEKKLKKGISSTKKTPPAKKAPAAAKPTSNAKGAIDTVKTIPGEESLV
ncbi:MAG: SCP2 sterol-binding domain-containing protein [Oscillospiraceae bacterium]|nr:SCP2 sterol-binding domain-containing protein [Oscillospiraceae bacterium]